MDEETRTLLFILFNLNILMMLVFVFNA